MYARWLAGMCGVAAVAIAVAVSAQESVEPEGQIYRAIRKDGIPAIFAPKFVAAGDADLPDNEGVIGLKIGEDARAYALSLLDGHEIVNDVVGGKPVAVTW